MSMGIVFNCHYSFYAASFWGSTYAQLVVFKFLINCLRFPKHIFLHNKGKLNDI